MVEMTKISQHGETSKGSQAANGGMIGVTNVNWGMYTIVWGTGSKRQSKTMHCTEGAAEAFKNSLKDTKE